MSMTINLADIRHAPDLIERMTRKGYHVSRADLDLFPELEKYTEQYRALFALLRYELHHDPHGYYYLSGQPSVGMNRTTSQMAVTVWTLVETLTNQGYEPVSYLLNANAPVGEELIAEQYRSNKEVLDVAKIDSTDRLFECYARLKNSGFCDQEGHQFYFRVPVYRFLSAALNLHEGNNSDAGEPDSNHSQEEEQDV